MKKAFTIIELIFVIIILGILSSLAVHKIVNVRTDAYNLKQLEKFKTLVNDINTYYLLNGDYAIVKDNPIKPFDLSKMSGVRGDDDWKSNYAYGFNASDNNICFFILLSEREKDGYMIVENTVPENKNPNKACKSLLEFFKHRGGVDVNDVSGLFGMRSISSAFK